MKDPKDEVPFDDSDDLDKEDQMSQQDKHATGIDPDPEDFREDKHPDTDLLKQSFDASEASYTLNTDDAPKSKGQKK